MFGVLTGSLALLADRNPSLERGSDFLRFSAPAGDRPATAHTVIDGVSAAVLPNGRLVTPAGTEVNVQAPKPFGLALSPDGEMLATLNSGAAPFSLTLISQLSSSTPEVRRINVNASFMGVTFSHDSRRVYLSGGENGNIWVADAALGSIIGSVNLNGPSHPLDRPLDAVATPALRFRVRSRATWCLAGTVASSTSWIRALSRSSPIEVSKIQTGVDAQGRITEPDNFEAVVGQIKVGRYPYGINLSPDDRTLFVTHVGVFEYTHLGRRTPPATTTSTTHCAIPGAGYPERDPTGPRDPGHESRSPQPARRTPRSGWHSLRIHPERHRVYRPRPRQSERP